MGSAPGGAGDELSKRGYAESESAPTTTTPFPARSAPETNRASHANPGTHSNPGTRANPGTGANCSDRRSRADRTRRRSRVTLHPVTEAAYRLDESRAQLPTQARHEHFHRVRVAREVLRVDVFRQLRLRHELTAAMHQVRQHAKLVTRQLHLRALQRHFA